MIKLLEEQWQWYGMKHILNNFMVIFFIFISKRKDEFTCYNDDRNYCGFVKADAKLEINCTDLFNLLTSAFSH